MSVAAPALPARAGRLWAALLATTLMNLPLGSVYSFSVLLRPIEQELAIPRSALSLVFGLATAGFTVGSVAAAFLYRVASAPVLVLLSAAAAAGGIAVAATATGLAQLLLGYGVVFGTGGGIAYIVLQQGVNMLVQQRRGLVNGYIVSLYPMGAMIATPAFHACNEAFGWRTTLAGLAAVVAACGAAAALLARHGRARLAAPKGSAAARPTRLGLTFYKLSATFFLAASAGLMVLSQAREIVGTYGGTAALAVGATTGITGAIALARIGGGWLVDRFAVPHVMCVAHALALCGGLLLTLFPAPVTAVLGHGRRRLRLRLRLDRRRHRHLLAARRLRPRRRPHLRRLVPGRDQPAGAGGLPVRPDGRLRHAGVDRRWRQPRRHGARAHDAEAGLSIRGARDCSILDTARENVIAQPPWIWLTLSPYSSQGLAPVARPVLALPDPFDRQLRALAHAGLAAGEEWPLVGREGTSHEYANQHQTLDPGRRRRRHRTRHRRLQLGRLGDRRHGGQEYGRRLARRRGRSPCADLRRAFPGAARRRREGRRPHQEQQLGARQPGREERLRHHARQQDGRFRRCARLC
jgi:MFS transporter, OFA family, oxalate/formate antiporter